MKSKLLLLAALFSVCTELNAQINKGTFLVGENLNLNGTFNTPNNFNLNSDTYLGFFIKDNLAIGLVPGYSYKKQPFKNNTYSLSPYLRVYRNLLYKRLYAFAEAKFVFSSQKFKSGPDFAPDMNRIKTAGFVFRPAADFFITNSIAVEILFDFISFSAHSNKFTDFSGNTTNTKNYDYKFRFDLQGIFVGFMFYPGRQKDL